MFPTHRRLLCLLLFQWKDSLLAFPLQSAGYKQQSHARRDSVNLAATKSLVTDDTKQASKKKRPSTSRSTAVFALNDSCKRSSEIALRVLENDAAYKSLEIRDRAFARLLLTTVQRRQGQIDKVIRKVIERANPRKKASDLLCEATLRIGAAQILFLDTPSYAAIKETVDVLRMHPQIKIDERQIKFVNALLRRIDREGQELLRDSTILDNVQPKLVQEWIKSYGKESTTKIIEAAMVQSPIFVTVNCDPNSTDEERLAQVEKVRSMFSDSALSDEAELLEQGSIMVPDQQSSLISKWPGYDDGKWWVQDPSASLPAVALYKALTSLNSKRPQDLHVVDLCSAPGGKTAQLCSMGFGRVTAVEVSSRRVKALRENLERLRMADRCEVVVGDGREWKPDNNVGVDAVLLDAPCSATGVGSRRPDVLQKSPDLKDITKLQKELISHVVENLLRPGGVMVYATCSLLKSESEEQMKHFLSREDGPVLQTIPFQRGEIPGFDEAIDENGWLRILPGHLPGSLSYCDGFFVARMRRAM